MLILFSNLNIRIFGIKEGKVNVKSVIWNSGLNLDVFLINTIFEEIEPEEIEDEPVQIMIMK